MHIRINQGKFLKALAHMHRVVERRNTIMPISNVLLNATNEGLELKATDLDIELRENISAEIEKTGILATPAHLLYEIIRKLPSNYDIELSCFDGKQLSLKSGQANFSLPCQSGDDFPTFDIEQISHNFSLLSKDLKKLIDSTLFAASTDETRYYLNGIYFHILKDAEEESSLCTVATDGHRLARCKILSPLGSENMPCVIVPRKAMGELQKLLSDQLEAMVFIDVSDIKIRFRIENIVMSSKLIDGNFPDYVKVIPFSNDKIVEIQKEEFSSAVDLVSTIMNDRTRSVKLHLKKNVMELEVASNETARAEKTLECSYDSDPMTIGFNASYLLDIVSQLSGKSIKILLSTEDKAAILSEIDDSNVLYVLMPMRI